MVHKAEKPRILTAPRDSLILGGEGEVSFETSGAGSLNFDPVEGSDEWKKWQKKLAEDWATPDEFSRVVIPRYGLNFDAAAGPENTLFGRGIDCANNDYITENEDALAPNSMWAPMGGTRSRVWLNPPHAKFLPWFEKAHQQITHPSGRIDIIVVMALPSFSLWAADRAV